MILWMPSKCWHLFTKLRPSVPQKTIFIDTVITLYRLHQTGYLPAVTSCCQLPVRVKCPLPSSVAPRLTEMIPVTQGDVDGDSHDLLLQDFKLELGLDVE